MTSEFLTLNSSDLETLISKSNCSCHFLNPNKTRIILWKEIKEDNSEIYYLRIGIQKFISYPLKDKNKALYWRFNCFEKGGVFTSDFSQKGGVSASELTQAQVEEPLNPDPHNPVTKYQQRLEKTAAINHGKSNSATNSSEHSESTSH